MTSIFRAGILVVAAVVCVASARPQRIDGSTQLTGSTGTAESPLLEGSRALSKGENAAAERDFRKVLAAEPNSVEVLNDLAISLARQGEEQQAIPFYERALKLLPGDPATTRNLAIAYFRAQRYREAWPLLKPLASRPDAGFQILDLAGLTLFALDRYTESAHYLSRAIRLKPSDLSTLYMLGRTRLRVGDNKGVTEVFAKIMAVNPNSPEAHVMMGDAYDKMFHEQDALREYQAAEKEQPNFPGVHSGLGLIYWKQDRMDEAKEEFQTELRNSPGDPVSNCLLAQILVRQNLPAEAARRFRRAIAANPRYKEAFFGLGQAELMLGHPEAAIPPLRGAISIDANYAQAHFVLGTALGRLGRTAEAAREQRISAEIQARQQAEYTRKLNEH